MELLLIILLLMIIVVLALIEYKVSRVIYTPFILFAFPQVAIMFVQYYSTKLYGLVPLSKEYVFTMCGHFLIVWLIDMAVLKLFYSEKGKRKLNDEERQLVLKRNKWGILEVIGIVSALYLLVYFVLRMRGISTIGQIVQEEFQSGYADGVNFFLRLICMLATIYFLSNASMMKKRYFVFGMLCLLPNVLTFVKGTILICIVAGLLGNIIVHERKMNIKYLLIAGLSAVAVFFGIYLVEICIWEPKKFLDVDTYKYIFAKFNCYLMAGLQGFNVRLGDSVGEFALADNVIFAPVANALAKFGITQRIDPVCDIWTTLGDVPNYGIFSTNVYSHVGMLVLYCGHVGACLMEALIALFQITLFVLMRNTRKTAYCILYPLFASVYVLSWFNYYLSHTFWAYLLIMVVIFEIYSEFRLKKSDLQKLDL